MDRAALEAHAPQYRATPQKKFSVLPELFEFRRPAVERATAKSLAVESKDVSVAAFAELRRVLNERTQHWLKIERRAADNLQDFGSRRLLLQSLAHLRVGLCERPILPLELSEQADVFDGDHGLVGECLKQSDLLLGEWAHLESPNGDRSDGLLLAQQGHGHDGPDTRAAYASLNAWGLPIQLLLDVFDVHRSLLKNRAPGCGLQRKDFANSKTRNKCTPRGHVAKRAIVELIE